MAFMAAVAGLAAVATVAAAVADVAAVPVVAAVASMRAVAAVATVVAVECSLGKNFEIPLDSVNESVNLNKVLGLHQQVNLQFLLHSLHLQQHPYQSMQFPYLC